MNKVNSKTNEDHNRKPNSKDATIMVHAFSQTNSLKELSNFYSVTNEQNFGAFITDLDTIQELELNSPNVVLALNFPYKAITPELELEILISEYLEELDNLGGYLLSLNKFDLQNRRFENIREYLIQLGHMIDKQIYIVIDVDALYEPQDIISILGMIEPYSTFKSTLFGSKNIQEVQKLIKNTFLKPLSYFTFETYDANMNIGGFENIMLSGRAALNLLKNEKNS